MRQKKKIYFPGLVYWPNIVKANRFNTAISALKLM